MNERQKDVLQSLRDFAVREEEAVSRPNIEGRDSGDVPIDGGIFVVSEFLNTLAGKDQEFYRRYLKHLGYFTGLYRVEGDDNIVKLAPAIFRQVHEFGKVAITKIAGKFVVMAIVELEYNAEGEITKVTGTATRTGIGYLKSQNVVNLDPAETVVLRQNFQGLPFIFFWKDVIENIIKLKKAAITGSISTIKKFKRNLANNDSDISRIETQSMMDPNTPYINNIVSPTSYRSENDRAVLGDGDKVERVKATNPNGITFENVGSDTQTFWDNLTNYINFEYYQNGRRTNTNKKGERNLEGEINAEVVNFDALEGEFDMYLEIFTIEMKEKFSVDVEISKISDIQVEKGVVMKEEQESAGGDGFSNKKSKKGREK